MGRHNPLIALSFLLIACVFLLVILQAASPSAGPEPRWNAKQVRNNTFGDDTQWRHESLSAVVPAAASRLRNLPSVRQSPQSYFHECQEWQAKKSSPSMEASTSWSNDGNHNQTRPSAKSSIDRWRMAHCEWITQEMRNIRSRSSDTQPNSPQSISNQTQPRHKSQMLFVDAREEPERYNEFLVRVRKSGFAGHIVMMVYYPGDIQKCMTLGNTFGTGERAMISEGASLAPNSKSISGGPPPTHASAHSNFECYSAVDVPKWEITFQQYYGIAGYFKKNPSALRHYRVAAVVRPELVTWCGNPFDDVDADTYFGASAQRLGDSKNNLTVFAAWRHDSRKYIFDVLPNQKMVHKRHYVGPLVPKDDILVGTPHGIHYISAMLLKHAAFGPRRLAFPSWSYFQTIPIISKHIRPFSDLGPDRGAAYSEMSCSDPVYPCTNLKGGVRSQHHFCFRIHSDESAAAEMERFQSPEKNPRSLPETGEFSVGIKKGDPYYSPYCYMSYRHAVSEVPRDGSVSLQWVADPQNMLAASAIKNAISGHENDIYSDPPQQTIAENVALRKWGGFSDECPDGKMAVMSMLGTYTLKKVRPFIGSFLLTADKCVKLVIFLKWTAPASDLIAARTLTRPFTSLAEKYPTRIEVVWYVEIERNATEVQQTVSNLLDAHNRNDKANEHRRAGISLISLKHYSGRHFVDQRFELAKEWLEINYKDYRYASNVDSRDLIFHRDPLGQLLKVLRENGPVGEEGSYIGREFAGAISEAYPLGSFSTFHEGTTKCAMDWITPCGVNCFQYLNRQSFTNGEPFAVINSGNLVGTTVGLMHYYRAHVRMTIESNYQFTHSDQGMFTFYFYGALADTGFPHRLLAMHASRSGFSNPPHFGRIIKSLEDPQEYTSVDCAGNHVSIVHQADRDPKAEELIGLRGIDHFSKSVNEAD